MFIKLALVFGVLYTTLAQVITQIFMSFIGHFVHLTFSIARDV